MQKWCLCSKGVSWLGSFLVKLAKLGPVSERFPTWKRRFGGSKIAIFLAAFGGRKILGSETLKMSDFPCKFAFRDPKHPIFSRPPEAAEKIAILDPNRRFQVGKRSETDIIFAWIVKKWNQFPLEGRGVPFPKSGPPLLLLLKRFFLH